MAEARERDELEPPGVSTGKVLAAVAAVFGLLFTAIVLMSLFFKATVPGPVDPAPHALPAPQLETSSNPRMTADRGHGPKPYRERPVDRRAEERAPPSPTLEEAMKAEAARGAAAYGPVGGGG